MEPQMTSGALFSIKEQYSGIVYVPVGDGSVLPPQYANWTYIDPTQLILTIYTPGTEDMPQSEIVEPQTVSFAPGKER
jgi:hypothetical protein